LAILTSFTGFFCGSISFTWLSRFFYWNGFIGLLILLFSKFIGLITPNRINDVYLKIKREKQNGYSKSQVNRFPLTRIFRLKSLSAHYNMNIFRRYERVFFLESDFSFSQVKEDTLFCLIYFRRGFLFALLADGFKVGS